jgi:alpha,alpha-trehalase
MFEKFSIRDVDSSGRGGEYTVQAGFGWTNGVVLWVASSFGEQLVAPVCPDPLFATNDAGGTAGGIGGNSSGGSPSNKKNSALQVNVTPHRLFGIALLMTAMQFLVG